MNEKAQKVFALVDNAAKSLEYCRSVIAETVAHRSKEYGGWEYVQEQFGETSCRTIWHIGYAGCNLEWDNSERLEQRAKITHQTAKEEKPLYELIALVGSDPIHKEKGVYHALEYSGNGTKSGWAIAAQSPRITFKRGTDFRTAAPYCFVRLDRKEVIHLWPEMGSSSHWLDIIDK